jgi:hypothetical protein|tara:strand:+ start:1077 stop:1310 length:234 start_codon:yes stop_codon:yes gene_type:complete
MSEEIKAVESEAAPQGEASPELTVNDLSQIKQVIDVASQRGAFKPNEMVAVGTIYSKLETFLSAVAAQAPADEAKGE